MDKFEIYNDISARTNGDIYVGIVGPVRTGKSTFIKKFMEKIVLPNVELSAEKDRMIDELPQSGNGKQIMTTQPKFVPNKAIKVDFNENVSAKVRMVDCVGYFVSGAEGAENNDGTERLVKTPWSDNEITLREAAEIGTKKVICDHSTISVLVTTDGSIGDISRLSYVPAEERVVGELKQAKKPFVVLVNSTKPDSDATKKLTESLSEKYKVPVVSYNIEKMEETEFCEVLEIILYEFPVAKINVDLPKWVRALPAENELIKNILERLKSGVNDIEKIKDASKLQNLFKDNENIEKFSVKTANLSDGTINYEINLKNSVFYNLLSAECGINIEDDFYLMSYIKHLVYAKHEYDKLKGALEQVKQTGYGVVNPGMEDMTLEEPQIVSKGGNSGVKLKASAPSLHIMRVDVETEVCPAIGSGEQSQNFAEYIKTEFQNNPQNIWNTNMFGKSLSSLVKEGIDSKVNNIPEEAQIKIRKTLTKIVNERRGGIICILL